MAGRPFAGEGEPPLSFERLERYRQQGACIEFEIVLIDEQWFVFASASGEPIRFARQCVVGERSGEPNTMDVNRLFNQVCKVKERFPASNISINAGKFRLVEVPPDEETQQLLAMIDDATPVQIGGASRVLGLSRGASKVPESIVNAIIYLRERIGHGKVAAALAALGVKRPKSDK